MCDDIEFTQLMADAPAHGGEVRLAEALRTAYLESDPDDVATTAGEAGDRAVITSGGKPMTVSQVQAEIKVLIVGE